MTQQEKFKYASQLTSVASTGLSFVSDSLSRIMNSSTDMAYLRSFYILLSYNLELILKSRIVMAGNFYNKKDINDELHRVGHDIAEIGKALNSELADLGIKEVAETGNQYKISTINNEEVLIENFIKIRYDFLDDVIRIIDNQEYERLKKCVEVLVLILRNAKNKNAKESQ